MPKPKKQKTTTPKKEVVKEAESEDWCFLCYDGGDLMLCDYSDCLKVYHPKCVGQDDDSPTTDGEQHWTCDRHSCFECHKATKFYCYCCPKATCGQCLQGADFALVKGNKGLCGDCLELVLLVEEKDNLDADGVKIDLRDRNTFECLFLEYWDIIKEKEDLNLEDVYTADARLKKGLSFKSKRNGKGRKDFHVITSDSDVEDEEEFETVAKEKGPKAFEFLEWGSKPLIHFLRSLGKDTTNELSQDDVYSIVCQYIQQKELFDPKKRKRVLCDETLRSLFRRKAITKNRIYNLLESHFVVNIDPSDEDDWDEVENCSPVKEEKTSVFHKKLKTLNSDRKCQEIEAEVVAQESCFASIVADNIKLVYLRKSLVQRLSNDPKEFEQKVIGSFVRVKNDPRDCTQKNSHQLLQVIGVKQTSETGENNNEVILRLINVPTDVHISKLSDFDFCEVKNS
ncbi:zinc ion binding DNA binding [Euphorbia peplus]|nr:zinc ion binding DNA binding [Euphorbia peplus]